MLEEMVIDGIEILGGGEAADPADDALLRAAQGDQRAFAELYDMMSARVFGLIVRVVVDRSQSEEVLQEVFLEAWQTATSFDTDRGRARSWLLTIAHRRAVDRVRASQASRRRDLVVGARDLAESRPAVDDEVALLIDAEAPSAPSTSFQNYSVVPSCSPTLADTVRARSPRFSTHHSAPSRHEYGTA